jgi:hypothetical protein
MPMVSERRKPRAVMTLAEEQLLLANAAPHLRVIIIAALQTGMRRGELLTERWEHVDFTRRLLSVTHSKTAGGEAREIPLTNRLYEILASMQKPCGLVFEFRHRPLHILKTAWKAAIRRAGIRYYRFHDLRHTFNTRLMEAGVMQEVRKALMGHSSGEDVHAIYTHVELPMKRDAIRKLEEWIARETALAEKERQSLDTTRSDGRDDPTGALRALPDDAREDPRIRERRVGASEASRCGGRGRRDGRASNSGSRTSVTSCPWPRNSAPRRRTYD